MKQLSLVLAVALTLLVSTALAADSWKGTISDSKCGITHAEGTEKDRKCVTVCVKNGQKPVFITEDKKLVQIANPDKVMEHLGHKVVVTGRLEGDTLTIESVKMPE